jgi:hypothetical protein
MGQVERNMNRFIKIRIRLLVILRQIFQFFSSGLPSRFRRSLTRARRIASSSSFSFHAARSSGDDVAFVFHRVIASNVLHDVLELRIFGDTRIVALQQLGPNGVRSPYFT